MYTSLTSKGINRNTSRARLPLVSLLEVRTFVLSFGDAELAAHSAQRFAPLRFDDQTELANVTKIVDYIQIVKL